MRFSRLHISKKAQDKVLQLSAAPFLIILTLIFVFYVILLQPDDRAALLAGSGGDITLPSAGGNQPTTGSDNTNYRGGTFSLEEFVFEGPGRISEQSRDEYDHKLTPFNFRGEFAGTRLVSENDFFLKASLFNSDSREITFYVEDVNAIRDVVLTFGAPIRDGILTVELNGATIYSGYVSTFNVNPIMLSEQGLDFENKLTFSVNSPGLAFWKANQFQISQLSITANKLDAGGLTAKQTVDLRPVEIQQLQSAKIRFNPDCNGQNVAKLHIEVNSVEIYQSIPDCGVINTVPVPRSSLSVGANTIYFESEGGTYLVDQIELQTNLDEDDGVTFYFDLDEDYFDSIIESDPVCGEVDGICPSDCSENVDKDCCFVEYTGASWCDVPTTLSGDRCVGRVSSFNFDRCPSGYEDESGNVDDDYEGTCGDDDDNFCPSGCSQLYDKDCCLVEDSDAFWCDDLPTGGVSNICKLELSYDDAALCPSGYEGEGKNPPFNFESRRAETEERNLDEDLRVIAEFYFVDDEEKHEAQLNINGYLTSFDTRKHFVEKDISDFVRDNNNYIQLLPRSDMSLVEVRITLKER